MRVVTGEEACPGGSAGGSGDVTLSEADAFFDQLVEVGRDAVGVTQGCNGVMALLIGQDEEDVGSRRHGSVCESGKIFTEGIDGLPGRRVGARPIESLGRYATFVSDFSKCLGYRFHWCVPEAYGSAIAVCEVNVPHVSCSVLEGLSDVFLFDVHMEEVGQEANPCCSKLVQKGAGVSKTVEQVGFIAVEWLVDKKSSRIL